jgi:hypothetical protein
MCLIAVMLLAPVSGCASSGKAPGGEEIFEGLLGVVYAVGSAIAPTSGRSTNSGIPTSSPY